MRTVMIVEPSGVIEVRQVERTYSDHGTPWDTVRAHSRYKDWATLLSKRKPWVQPGRLHICAFSIGGEFQ